VERVEGSLIWFDVSWQNINEDIPNDEEKLMKEKERRNLMKSTASIGKYE
jgi:hypothetical protein